MVWSNVASQYRLLFARVVAGHRIQALRLLPLVAAHG